MLGVAKVERLMLLLRRRVLLMLLLLLLLLMLMLMLMLMLLLLCDGFPIHLGLALIAHQAVLNRGRTDDVRVGDGQRPPDLSW